MTKAQPVSGEKKERIREMFNTIAPSYDFLNRFLSAGIDKTWRKKSIDILVPHHPKQILDLATGTAELAIEAARLHPEKITGIDISENMLALGRKKVESLGLENLIELVRGDSEKISFDNNSFDAVTVAFGIRNFQNPEKGLEEMYRVLKKNGMAVILEFSMPRKLPVKQLYGFYFRRICPVIGKMISKNFAAYKYLPESVAAFPSGKKFLEIMEKNGFEKTQCLLLTSGIASIYTGVKE